LGHLGLARLVGRSLVLLASAGCAASRGDPRDAGGDTTAVNVAPDASDASDDADGSDAVPTCGPDDAVSFTPRWNPPAGPHEGACTAAQLAGLVAACFAAFATVDNCTAWEEEPSNLGCLGCWAGPITASRWAPYLYANNPGETDYLNVAGCVALADPTAVPCAKELASALECELALCLPSCPVPNAASPEEVATAENALGRCYDKVDDGRCRAFAASASACAGPLEDAGPASFCFAASSNTNALLEFFSLACGSAAKDAGQGEGG
jgi:hypothetical protein